MNIVEKLVGYFNEAEDILEYDTEIIRFMEKASFADLITLNIYFIKSKEFFMWYTSRSVLVQMNKKDRESLMDLNRAGFLSTIAQSQVDENYIENNVKIKN